MAKTQYSEDCPGCRPVLLDLTTWQPLDADNPKVQALEECWAQMSQADREAFHRATCLSSRLEADLAVARRLAAVLHD